MSKIVLKKFFDVSSQEEKECCICMGVVNNFDDAFIMYNCCGKIFHNECITKNLFYNNYNCPLCNTSIDSKNQEILLNKCVNSLFLYKNFKEKLSQLSGHTILELDNLYNSNHDLNSIIEIEIHSNEVFLNNENHGLINETGSEQEYMELEDTESENAEEINETESHVDYYNSNINEHEFNTMLCNCNKCIRHMNLHFIKCAMIADDVDKFINYINQFHIKINDFKFESKIELLVYLIKNNVVNILTHLIPHLSELQNEEIPQIYNEFIDKFQEFHFDICELIFKNFKLSICKIQLQEIENEYKANGDEFAEHEIFKLIKSKNQDENMYYN